MKTAIKWTFSRGLVPCETIELAQAVAQDNAAERVEVVSATAKAPVSPSAAFLLDAPAPDPSNEYEASDSPADTDPTADAPDDGDAPPWGGE
jgi:recombinational DNA repair protein RecT